MGSFSKAWLLPAEPTGIWLLEVPEVRHTNVKPKVYIRIIVFKVVIFIILVMFLQLIQYSTLTPNSMRLSIWSGLILLPVNST